ncbi:unnamed protein product [Amoebophrya sp. A25]|nr:unnamed protein product [Amoebophrya sp. A25]|eukprot:GSA25T00008934001.1
MPQSASCVANLPAHLSVRDEFLVFESFCDTEGPAFIDETNYHPSPISIKGITQVGGAALALLAAVAGGDGCTDSAFSNTNIKHAPSDAEGSSCGTSTWSKYGGKKGASSKCGGKNHKAAAMYYTAPFFHPTYVRFRSFMEISAEKEHICETGGFVCGNEARVMEGASPGSVTAPGHACGFDYDWGIMHLNGGYLQLFFDSSHALKAIGQIRKGLRLIFQKFSKMLLPEVSFLCKRSKSASASLRPPEFALQEVDFLQKLGTLLYLLIMDDTQKQKDYLGLEPGCVVGIIPAETLDGGRFSSNINSSYAAGAPSRPDHEANEPVVSGNLLAQNHFGEALLSRESYNYKLFSNDQDADCAHQSESAVFGKGGGKNGTGKGRGKKADSQKGFCGKQQKGYDPSSKQHSNSSKHYNRSWKGLSNKNYKGNYKGYYSTDKTIFDDDPYWFYATEDAHATDVPQCDGNHGVAGTKGHQEYEITNGTRETTSTSRVAEDKGQRHYIYKGSGRREEESRMVDTIEISDDSEDDDGLLSDYNAPGVLEVSSSRPSKMRKVDTTASPFIGVGTMNSSEEFNFEEFDCSHEFDCSGSGDFDDSTRGNFMNPFTTGNPDFQLLQQARSADPPQHETPNEPNSKTMGNSY